MGEGRRRRNPRPHQSSYAEPPSEIQQWRARSPTVRIIQDSFADNASKIKANLGRVKKGLESARYSALSSGKDARLKLWQYIKALQKAERATERSEEVTDLEKLLKELIKRRESHSFTAGLLVFGCLCFLSGSQPWCLPWVYLVFALVCLPWRTVDFCKRRWVFFLLDNCYWTNLAVVTFLICAPSNPRLFQAVYALSEGPLASALLVWQTAWVLGSAAHTISTLIHQLPGLALFCHKYYSPPAALADYLPASPPPLPFSFQWSIFMPLLFYFSWQLVYFLIVQILCRRWILANKMETSFSCLARRAQKSNNFWNRTVRKGSSLRRVFMFGLFQALYTVGVLLAFALISQSYWACICWQVVKITSSVFYGSREICEKTPRRAIIKVWQQRTHSQ